MQSTNQVESSRSLPVLRRGSQGDDVKYLQRLLNDFLSSNLTIDGNFGPKTEAAVKQAQEFFGLQVDGIVGSKTWYYLIAYTNPASLPTLRRGSKGDAVKFLQERLSLMGYSLVIDGEFGAKTEAAVKQFQKDRGLTVDGIVGPKTWTAMFTSEEGGC
jgi:peptidoglycan hydrolase-like protein with peptidoglycan-binding domain